jgi:hypothetical protein
MQYNAKAKAFEQSNFNATHFPYCGLTRRQLTDVYSRRDGDSSFDLGYALEDNTPHRRLEEPFNFTLGAEMIYKKYRVSVRVCPSCSWASPLNPKAYHKQQQKPAKDLMVLLAKVHDFDDALVKAWKTSGIEKAFDFFCEVRNMFGSLDQWTHLSFFVSKLYWSPGYPFPSPRSGHGNP